MSKKFSYNQKDKLDNEQRRKALPPRETLEKLGLKEGDIMADIGAGIGYFSIPGSEIVGESGKVFAMDISVEMTDELEKKVHINENSNIAVLVTEENDFKLDDDSVTFAFICTVLHEAEDIDDFLKEAKRITKEGGKLVIIEWKKEESDFGPPIDHRLAINNVIESLKKNGINNINLEEINKNFYAIKAKV